MKMTDWFVTKYADKMQSNFKRFNYIVRYCGDSITSKALESNGISQIEIKDELTKKLIRYEPNVFQNRGGYTLTAAGIKAIYDKIKNKY